MSLFDPIDIYCERVGAGFFAEPFNLLSNGFFVLAGAMIIWRSSSALTPVGMKIYGSLVVLVGLCSLSFHGWANQLTMGLDVLSILLCVFFVIFIFSRKILSLAIWQLALVYLVLVVGMVMGSRWLSFEFFNGSEDYFGVLITLLLLTMADHRLSGSAAARSSGSPKYMWAASALFATSLVVRMLDHPDGVLCHHLPVGVHYFWHAFNALVFYLIYLRFTTRASASPEPSAHESPS